MLGVEQSVVDEDHNDEVADLVDYDGTEEDCGDNPGRAMCVVKMKLSSFIAHEGLRRKLDSLVLDMNKLMGEGYIFANFHIARILERGDVPVPVINRNFYYRCLLAVSTNNCRSATLGEEFERSRDEFEKLRDKGQSKIDIRGNVRNQIIADLSILMATMATNHLWSNLERRITTYLKWKHPRMAQKLRTDIVAAVAKCPSKNLDDIFKTSPSVSKLPSTLPTRRLREAKSAIMLTKKMIGRKEPEGSKLREKLGKVQDRFQRLSDAWLVARKARVDAYNAKCTEARCISSNLREVLPIKSGRAFASKAHMTLPLYYKILSETLASGNTKLRPFSLLPYKSGFTLSHIPISNMAFFHIVKECGFESCRTDISTANYRSIWDRFANLKLVETVSRTFGNRIVTDGFAVSILMNKPSCLCCSMQTDAFSSRMTEYTNTDQDGVVSFRDNVIVAAVDPGVTDIVTVARLDGEVRSYSSAQYYRKGLIFKSQKQTNVWNLETTDLVRDMPKRDSCWSNDIGAYAKVYLDVAPKLLLHRAAKGYRGLRFSRYCRKQKLVVEIADMVAPKGGKVLVGFGDWKGVGSTPISRRTAGPLQAIRFELRGRNNVIMEDIDEFRSSKQCSCCGNSLCNMVVAKTHRRKKSKTSVDEGSAWECVEGRMRIHKILHCKRSQVGGRRNKQSVSNIHCGKTWDRDVNASRNILKLTIHQVFGKERPPAFLRTTKTKQKALLNLHDTNLGTQPVERSILTDEATRKIFEHLSKLLNPPTDADSKDDATHAEVDV